MVETACVGRLRSLWAGRGETAKEKEFPVSCNRPQMQFSLRTSWLAGALPHSRARVYQAVASGLRQLACSVLMNAQHGVDVYQAQSRLEGVAETHGSVLDLKQCKYESWLKAYHLVRAISLAEPVT